MKRQAAALASPEKKRVTRHLRSKEETKIDASLFNYEEDPAQINPDELIHIADYPVHGEVIPPDFEYSTEKIQFKTDLVQVKEEDDQADGISRRSFRRSTLKKVTHDDPLTEDLYAFYHRRMEKEEKRMLNRDREKVLAEADKMKTQLESLQQPDWPKVLPSITYVRNPRDFDELQQKREWTMHSLETLLDKFDDWKRREDRLLGKAKLPPIEFEDQVHILRYHPDYREDYMGFSDTDDEEDNMTVEEIKKKRRRVLHERFGSSIRLTWEGMTLIRAAPFEHTRSY